MNDLEVYNITIHAIKEYFETYESKDSSETQELFLQGGCYWLAEYLHRKTTYSYLMFNKQKEHCAVEIWNHLYDITGRISYSGYTAATLENISYMKKHYIPEFETEQLRNYLDEQISKITGAVILV